MCPQKQRHGTIRQNNIDPILSATSEWPILIQVVENMDQIWKRDWESLTMQARTSDSVPRNE